MSAAYRFGNAEPWMMKWAAMPILSSGAMNSGVPITAVDVRMVSSIRFEMPKSAILIHQGFGGRDLIRIF